MIRILFPSLLFFLIIGFWEFIVKLLSIPSYLLPSPSAIILKSVEQSNVLIQNSFITLNEAFWGFFLANVVSFLLAASFIYFKSVERAILPYAIALKTTPIIALMPLIILWFGSGSVSKIIAAALICFFPSLINSIKGFRSFSNETLDIFKSYGANKLQIFFKLRLPYALPYVFSALKVSSSLSIVGALVGEFIGANKGLGFVIIISSYTLDTTTMFSAVLAAAILGILFFSIIAFVEKLVITWAPPLD